MNTKQFTISILKEARADENRTPFTPDQIKTLITNFPNIKISVQPSKKRCFKDEEYSKAGAKLDEDITNSNIIFGIKEIDISKIIEDKTYLFFSHTSKVPNGNFQNSQDPAIIYKKKLLREVLKKNVTLIDYENIRDESKEAYRYLGFGRFAGIVGCYNTLNLYLKLNKKKLLPRAFEINSYEKIKKLIAKQNFNKLKILQTGRGNVAKGSMEILKHANIKQISLKDYLGKKYDEPVYCNISIREHIERKDGKDFSHQDFTLNPHEYKSKVKNYLFDTDILITGHYWESRFPKLFYQDQINEFKNLKIIGDITCDINGAIPTTIRSTTIAKPYYSVDINSMKEIDLGNKGIAVMAVDNLPSELPNEASEEFGKNIISEVLPHLFKKDDGRISRATTASQGKFTFLFSYLKDFIK